MLDSVALARSRQLEAELAASSQLESMNPIFATSLSRCILVLAKRSKFVCVLCVRVYVYVYEYVYVYVCVYVSMQHKLTLQNNSVPTAALFTTAA